MPEKPCNDWTFTRPKCVECRCYSSLLSSFSSVCSGMAAASSTISVISCRKSLAFWEVITAFTVVSSISFRVFPRNRTTFLRHFLIFGKSSGLYSLEISVVVASCKHCQNQFQITHVVPEVFFFQAFQFFVLPGCHARPCAGNLVSQDCIFLSPFPRHAFATRLSAHCGYGLPKGADVPIPRNSLFSDRFLNARSMACSGSMVSSIRSPAHPCQPRLKRLGFRGGDRLDNPQ